MVGDRTFRQDLYYRLCVLHVKVPPLRDRPRDLPELCSHLLHQITSEPPPLADGELSRLAAYQWPGNVRELRNVLERALIVQRGYRGLRPSELLTPAQSVPAPPQTEEAQDAPDEVPTLSEAERRAIEHALRACDGNLTQTARTLGVALSTLKRKLDRYGLR
jgi:DNA-binding NtrC family response regulator